MALGRVGDSRDMRYLLLRCGKRREGRAVWIAGRTLQQRNHGAWNDMSATIPDARMGRTTHRTISRDSAGAYGISDMLRWCSRSSIGC